MSQYRPITAIKCRYTLQWGHNNNPNQNTMTPKQMIKMFTVAKPRQRKGKRIYPLIELTKEQSKFLFPNLNKCNHLGQEGCNWKKGLPCNR